MNKLAALLVAPVLLAAQDAREIVQQSQNRTRSKSQQYQGTLRVIDSRGKVADKSWTYERTGSHGTSKSVLRFTEPPEVRGVALLVMNHPDRASDQWMWIPDIGRERRVALQDRSTRFFGTDFTFEDLEERDVDQYTYRLLGEEQGSWKMESKPKKRSQYTHSYVWIRKSDYAMARIENYKDEQLVRELVYSDIRNVENIPTAHKLEMRDVGRNSRTILSIQKLRYNAPLSEDRFTLQSLRRGS